MTKLLEEAIERVKALPEPDQDVAAEFLLGFADYDRMRYRLSDKQLREVEIAKDEARPGKFASQAEIDKAWDDPRTIRPAEDVFGRLEALHTQTVEASKNDHG